MEEISKSTGKAGLKKEVHLKLISICIDLSAIK